MQAIQLLRRVPVLALALAGCTTSGSSSVPRQNASKAFSAANTRMETAASSFGAHLAPVDGSFNLSSPCSQGGVLDLTGTFDNTASVTFDLDATFGACQESEGTLDGALHWTQTVSGSTIHDAWSGTLDFTDSQGAWTCMFDYSSTVDTAGIHYAGTICGYDVTADLGLDQ